eukprot:scaffold20439_cov136-Isochrysis_galbana.AAC.4
MSNLSIGSRHNLYMHRISIGYRIDRAPKHPRAHAPTPPTPAKEPAHPPDELDEPGDGLPEPVHVEQQRERSGSPRDEALEGCEVSKPGDAGEQQICEHRQREDADHKEGSDEEERDAGVETPADV